MKTTLKNEKEMEKQDKPRVLIRLNLNFTPSPSAPLFHELL